MSRLQWKTPLGMLIAVWSISAMAQPDGTLERLAENRTQIQEAVLTFQHERQSSFLDHPMTREGLFIYRKDLGCLLHYTRPERYVVQMNEEGARILRPGQEATRLRSREEPLLAGFSALLNVDTTLIHQHFDCTEKTNDAGFITLQLTPKRARGIENLDLTIGNDGLPREIVIREPSGDFQRMAFAIDDPIAWTNAAYVQAFWNIALP